jgi:hypothetical protein
MFVISGLLLLIIFSQLLTNIGSHVRKLTVTPTPVPTNDRSTQCTGSEVNVEVQLIVFSSGNAFLREVILRSATSLSEK